MPERRCIACGRRAPQEELVRLRVEERPEGLRVVVDAAGPRMGRGAYLCRSAACLDQAVRRRAFQRAFRRRVEVDRAELLHGVAGGDDKRTDGR